MMQAGYRVSVSLWTVSVLFASSVTCSARFTLGLPRNEEVKAGDPKPVEAPEIPPAAMEDARDLTVWETRPGVPYYIPAEDPEPYLAEKGSNLGPDYVFASPLKRGRNIRNDILKRSRLNQLIQQLLKMKGESRHYLHRASPVRFAAGRR